MSATTDREHEYRTAVQTAAEGIIAECRMAATLGNENTTDIHSLTHQACDSSYWSTYTHVALKVLGWSDNSEYLFVHFGEQEASSWSELHCRGAFYAMFGDITDAICAADDFDPNDTSTWLIEQDEDEDDE